MDARVSNDPLILRTLAERPGWFGLKVEPFLANRLSAQACWEWARSRNRSGYGRVALPQSIAKVGKDGSVAVLVHRVVWLALVGPIGEGLVLDHDGPNGCSNPACSNPAHLQAVTPAHNAAATGNSWSARKSRVTHCPRGHELGGVNNTAQASRVGQRSCLACSTDRTRRRVELLNEARLLLGLSTRRYIATYGQSARVAAQIISTHQREALA